MKNPWFYMRIMFPTCLLFFFSPSYSQCPVSDPSTSDACVFQSGTVNLTATGSTGFYNWYDSALGDSVVGTGSIYQTPF